MGLAVRLTELSGFRIRKQLNVRVLSVEWKRVLERVRGG
jgi:hypothetical protein